MNKLFYFHFLYHVKYLQFGTLRSPDSPIQWSVISTNFRKRLFGQIGNLVGHDWWPTIILITDICFLLKITRQVLHCLLWIDSFSLVYTILLYNSVCRITYPNNPTAHRPGVTYCLKFDLLILFFFWSVCLVGT